jgi:hypothetical protein
VDAAADYGPTAVSAMYRGRPAPSVKYVLKMLESCDNRTGGRGRRTPLVPGSSVCAPPPDEAPRVRDHPSRWRSASPQRGWLCWLTAACCPLGIPSARSVGFGSQGDVRPEKRGAVTLVCALEQEADVGEWHVGLSANKRCDQFVHP